MRRPRRARAKRTDKTIGMVRADRCVAPCSLRRRTRRRARRDSRAGVRQKADPPPPKGHSSRHVSEHTSARRRLSPNQNLCAKSKVLKAPQAAGGAEPRTGPFPARRSCGRRRWTRGARRHRRPRRSRGCTRARACGRCRGAAGTPGQGPRDPGPPGRSIYRAAPGCRSPRRAAVGALAAWTRRVPRAKAATHRSARRT